MTRQRHVLCTVPGAPPLLAQAAAPFSQEPWEVSRSVARVPTRKVRPREGRAGNGHFSVEPEF